MVSRILAVAAVLVASVALAAESPIKILGPEVGQRFPQTLAAVDQAGKPQSLKVAQGHEAGNGSVAAGVRFPSSPAAAEDGDEIVRAELALGPAQNDVVDIDECIDVSLHPGLLPHLAHGRGPRRLTGLDVPAWQAPQPLEGALGPHDEQHRLAAKDGGAGTASGPGNVGAG